MISQNESDKYWQMVNLIMLQLKGVYEGYKAKAEKDLTIPITFNEFYTLPNMGDLEDLLYIGQSQTQKQKSFLSQNMRCSMFIGFDEDNNLALSHGTHNEFDSSFSFYLMLRIYKTLVLNAKNPLLKNKVMSFSSRPGDLESKDDFFTLPDTKMIVSETSLLTYDDSLYQRMKAQALPAWLRAVLSNRISESGEEWTKYFPLYNSGTHNNQWIVLDYKPGNDSREKKLFIVDQYYDIVESKDITKDLYQQGYWASYNFPYFPDVLTYSKANGTFESQPRALLFKKYSKDVKNFSDLKNIVRINRQSTGDFCPDEIAPRCDLAKDLSGKMSLFSEKSIWKH